MKLIVCVDDRMGLAFGGKRQSRDRVLIADMLRYVGGAPLYISPYSEMLFAGEENLVVTDAPMERAGENYVFIEAASPQMYENEIDELVLYRWGRHYPSDFCLTLDLSKMKLTESCEFAGSSHDNIIKEVYRK